MTHYVPALEWSERALQARQFIFDFWAEHGEGVINRLNEWLLS